jgi:4-hydroxybenzoate polyprenyltransferase
MDSQWDGMPSGGHHPKDEGVGVRPQRGPGPLGVLYYGLLAMRPKQWTKNLVVFVAVVFSQNLFTAHKIALSLAAFGVLCLLTGAGYILNDIMDLEKDRQHPDKRRRPIASGLLPVRVGWVLSLTAAAGSLVGAFLIGTRFGLTACAYLVLQVSYCLILKHIVIVDVFSIAAGFFLRVLGGAEAISVPVSSWLLVCTFFMSLFLALAKRRHEIVLLEDGAEGHRRVLQKYDVLLVDQMMSVVTASTVVAYSVYTLAPDTVQRFGTTNLKYTIPFVLYGIYRYLYLVYRKNQGGSPESTLLQDVPMILNILLYGITVLAILYVRSL